MAPIDTLLEGAKLTRPQPLAKDHKQLRKVQSGRNNLPQGRANNQFYSIPNDHPRKHIYK